MKWRGAILAAWLISGSGAGLAEEATFSTPSDDRWHYPYNFSPGTRPLASCFSSVGNITYPLFNDRDGIFLLAWNTAAGIEPGRCPRTYGLRSVTVTLTHVGNASWPIDRTPDEWYTFDFNNDGVINGDGVPRGQPGDRDGESHDADPGRPLELFGVGFGSNSTYEEWTEFSPYYGGRDTANEPRDPFPFVHQEGTSALLHVEDNVKGTQNEGLPEPVGRFTPRPWAVGEPLDYQPGSQDMPFNVMFSIDLGLSQGDVRRYFQDQLRGGRIIVAVTSLRETVIFGGDPGALPTFFTKEGLALDPLAQAPQLFVSLVREASGDADGDCESGPGDVPKLDECLSGPGAEPASAPECTGSFDFDRDYDVDLRDVQRFVELYADPED